MTEKKEMSAEECVAVEVQEMLGQSIPTINGEVDSTPVIKGVCAWLLDVGVLDGNDDEVLSRIRWMAEEGRVPFVREEIHGRSQTPSSVNPQGDERC